MKHFCALGLLSSFVAASSPGLGANSDAFKLFQRAESYNKPVPFEDVRSPAQVEYLQKRQSRFRTPASEKFVVDGRAIPDVPFDVGESYAGLLPISDDPNESRKLFFWFFPSTNPAAGSEVTAWFNGGPGCSSLLGLLRENGPFTWQDGTYAPTQNPYTWVNLTNMVWIEQPVGVGYTQGKPNITDEEGVGEQLAGFWKQFIDTFDLKGAKVYLTGESYAGFYVPYIADEFISRNDKDYYNLAGVAINDPIIGSSTAQQAGKFRSLIIQRMANVVLEVDLRSVPAAPFMNYWQELFYLNGSTMEKVNSAADQCGFTDLFNKFLTFPPPDEDFPDIFDPANLKNKTCDVFSQIIEAVKEVNPCFDIYHITTTCPTPYSILGKVNRDDYQPPGLQIFFNRTDVQRAINAPVGTNWTQCSQKPVFAGNGSDLTQSPAQDGTLRRVIEATNNTIIGSGNLDFILPTNGTLLAIQNTTWNGKRGFQEYPGRIFYSPYHPEYNKGWQSGSGEVGFWGQERGLTFYQVQLAGHELPGYAGGPAYRVIEYMLGRVKTLDEQSNFSTQPNANFTGQRGPGTRKRNEL
ncbi:Alpha/Beta hydrolase protein [Phyllosticta capitalensis]